MPKHTFCYKEPEKEALRDLIELEELVSEIPQHKKDPLLQAEIYELVDQLQDLCPYTAQAQMIRKLIACFGDAYFFFNKTGNVCFLTDFVNEIKRVETVLQY